MVIIYHILAEGSVYDEARYDRATPKQEHRQFNNALRTLQRLGYKVMVEKVQVEHNDHTSETPDKLEEAA